MPHTIGNYFGSLKQKKGKYPEKIGIKANLVSFCAEFNGEQHIQNPKKSILGKIFYSCLKFAGNF